MTMRTSAGLVAVALILTGALAVPQERANPKPAAIQPGPDFTGKVRLSMLRTQRVASICWRRPSNSSESVIFSLENPRGC